MAYADNHAQGNLQTATDAHDSAVGQLGPRDNAVFASYAPFAPRDNTFAPYAPRTYVANNDAGSLGDIHDAAYQELLQKADRLTVTSTRVDICRAYDDVLVAEYEKHRLFCLRASHFKSTTPTAFRGSDWEWLSTRIRKQRSAKHMEYPESFKHIRAITINKADGIPMARTLNATGIPRRQLKRKATAADATSNLDGMILDAEPVLSEEKVENRAAVDDNTSVSGHSTAAIPSVADIQAAVNIATAIATGNMSRSFSLAASQSPVDTARVNLSPPAAAATSTTATATTAAKLAPTTDAQSAIYSYARTAAKVVPSHRNSDSNGDDDDGDDDDNDSVASADQLITNHKSAVPQNLDRLALGETGDVSDDLRQFISPLILLRCAVFGFGRCSIASVMFALGVISLDESARAAVQYSKQKGQLFTALQKKIDAVRTSLIKVATASRNTGDWLNTVPYCIRLHYFPQNSQFKPTSHSHSLDKFIDLLKKPDQYLDYGVFYLLSKHYEISIYIIQAFKKDQKNILCRRITHPDSEKPIILILHDNSPYRHFETLCTPDGKMQFKANHEIITKLRNLEQEYGGIKEADDELRLFLLQQETQHSVSESTTTTTKSAQITQPVANKRSRTRRQ